MENLRMLPTAVTEAFIRTHAHQDGDCIPTSPIKANQEQQQPRQRLRRREWPQSVASSMNRCQKTRKRGMTLSLASLSLSLGGMSNICFASAQHLPSSASPKYPPQPPPPPAAPAEIASLGEGWHASFLKDMLPRCVASSRLFAKSITSWAHLRFRIWIFLGGGEVGRW